MSKPRYGWWSYVKDMIRRYPALHEAHRELQRSSAVANYVAEPRTEGVGRPIERLALRELPRNEQREYDSVRRAVEATGRLKNGHTRLQVIEAVFWTRRHTLEGIALLVPCHYKTAQGWHNEFIRLVAKNFGLLEK